MFCHTSGLARNFRSGFKSHEPFLKNYLKKRHGIEVPRCFSSIRKIGQPTIESHPYLFKPGEVTPYISKNEYQERRQKLVEKINSEKKPNASQKYMIIIPSASKRYISNKIPYIFRQNTEFFYLTGCKEPDCCLIIFNNENKAFSTLFVRDKDEQSELWDGPQTSPEDAIEYFGVDRSLFMGELLSYIELLLKDREKMGLWFDVTESSQLSIQQTIGKIVKNNSHKIQFWGSPKANIDKLRIVKSSAEIKLMRKTCQIASHAILKTMEYSQPGHNEHEIFAKVDFESRIGGAEFLAYPPVVAGGERANIIHYITNNQIVKDGEMILMDAGCEFHGYTSDITRTWPINGKFTNAQAELYEAVLLTQIECINSLSKFPDLDSLFDWMCRLLGKYLKEIGVISKNVNGNELLRTAFKLCPHHVSHYLGMDVHDTPSVTRNMPIKPGMIVTVEPGVYIRKDNKEVPEEFRGMGIRIEDDVLITDCGPDILTRDCPKSIKDIENASSHKILNKAVK